MHSAGWMVTRALCTEHPASQGNTNHLRKGTKTRAWASFSIRWHQEGKTLIRHLRATFRLRGRRPLHLGDKTCTSRLHVGGVFVHRGCRRRVMESVMFWLFNSSNLRCLIYLLRPSNALGVVHTYRNELSRHALLQKQVRPTRTYMPRQGGETAHLRNIQPTPKERFYTNKATRCR